MLSGWNNDRRGPSDQTHLSFIVAVQAQIYLDYVQKYWQCKNGYIFFQHWGQCLNKDCLLSCKDILLVILGMHLNHV